MSNSSISSNSLSIDPCPFCRESIDQNGDESWYFRGDGPPPSYAVRCDSCGAQGPYGNGKFRKDHAGAQAEAVRLWNECARVALRAATGTVLATLRDLRDVAEASGRTVSLSADNILDVLAEIEGRDRRIQKLERAASVDVRGPVVSPRLAEVGTNGWAGQLWHPVLVIGETSKRYRVTSRDGKAYTFAANRKLAEGESMLVPKHAVRFVETAPACSCKCHRASQEEMTVTLLNEALALLKELRQHAPIDSAWLTDPNAMFDEEAWRNSPVATSSKMRDRIDALLARAAQETSGGRDVQG